MKKAGASKPEVGIPELGKLKPSEAETAEAQARKQRAAALHLQIEVLKKSGLAGLAKGLPDTGIPRSANQLIHQKMAELDEVAKNKSEHRAPSIPDTQPKKA